MSYKPKDQYFPALVDGQIRTTGSSLTLGIGEIAFVDISRTSSSGVQLLSDFSDLPPSHKLAIRIGEPRDYVSRSESNKTLSSIPFNLRDVTNIYVDAPQKAGIDVDDFVIGYNGATGSEIDLDNAENEVIEVCLKGDVMGYIGLPDRKHIANINLTAPITGVKGTDWTMHEIVENAFIELKNYRLPGNIPITDFVDVMLVNSENPATLPGSGSTTYNLIVEDGGTQSELGAVQAQYPALNVQRVGWEAGRTTYSTVATSLPTAYQPSRRYVVKGCEACDAGYTELSEGLVYQVVIADPTDQTTTVQALSGATAGTAMRIDLVGDTSTYTVVTDNALTTTEINTFVSANPTAKITLIADDVVDLCQGPQPAAVAWVAGETCNFTTEVYKITLRDTECNESRLPELQAAYPNLTIAQDGTATRAITLTGASGTANVNIGGTNYLATFATDLATTATNFVAAHAAAILSTHRVTVTSNGGVLNLAYNLPDAPSTLAVTGASGDLSGTIAAAVNTLASGLCQRTYYTTVNTTLVCNECSAEFRDIFTSEAPASFEDVAWEREPKVYSATARMGIRVRGKRSSLSGNEFLRDNMPFFDDSVEIDLVGGFPVYTNESYLEGTAEDRFAVKFFNRKSPAHNLGGNLRKYEEEAQVNFRGRNRYMFNNYGKIVNGQETRFEGLDNYIVYSITVSPHRFSSNFQQAQTNAFTYHIPVSLGHQGDLETVINRLAAAAGLPLVQAVSE